MSKIEQLIKEKCPNGVNYYNLNELVSISTGKLNANAMVEDGKYMFFTCDSKPFRIDKYAFDGEAILISGNGSQVGHLNYYCGKFNAYQRTYVLMNFKKIIGKYLYHFLDTYLKKHIKENSKKGSIPYITLPMLKNFKVAVPPIEVQEEIVKILDKFSELEKELEKELEARKKQYDFWREKLLTIDSKVIKLKDILKIKNGKDYKLFEKGEYPVYGSGGIITYINRYCYDKPTVLIPRKGSLNKLYYIDKPFWNVDTIYYTEINTQLVIPKYVYYFFFFLHLETLNIAGGVPSLTQAVLNNIKISLPSLQEQERIVKILDKFDKLINDISEGIPAELEARKKQYEYYRNKLLSFEELKKNE